VTRFALRNPHLIVVLVLGLIVIGVTATLRLPTDILPLFRTPAVQILTFYPGMPAEVMEKDITSRLERWTGQANGIAGQESKSMVGVSIVKDFFREDIDPNTAMSQVTSLAMSDLYYLPPGTIPPMVMPFDPTASIPLCLLTVYSDTYGEKELYDIAYFELRNRLQGITGVIAPAVYGGKLRRILSYVDPDQLQARGLSPMDVIDSIQRYNTMIPTGSAKLGEIDYQVVANGMVEHVSELDDIPMKLEDGAPVFVGDVAETLDSSAIQTNIVRVNGRRQVYIPIYRQPGANTIEIVEGVRAMLGPIKQRLPQGVNLGLIFDQSIYVRESIANLQHEALLGGGLAVLAILLFLRSWRSTLFISLAIPISVLAAFLGLYFTDNSLNIMTLGGLALVLGRLVDDAIVVLENTHRHLALGKPPLQAALDAASEVAMPVLVATITTAVVFFPVVFLSGLGRFLFTPLAVTVAFAIGASYLVSMTLVPICCAHFLVGRTGSKGAGHGNEPDTALSEARGPMARLERRCVSVVRWSLGHRAAVVIGALVLFIGSLAMFPRLGTELFPSVDTGQFTVRVRAPSGTRIENTEALVARVEDSLRNTIPEHDLSMLVSNIGVLLDWPAAYTPNSGSMDAFILVQLTAERQHSVFEHVKTLRPLLQREFPGIEFAFETGGMLTAALNFGLPSPINIQIEGNKLDVASELAKRVTAICEVVPGAVDVRIQQKLDYPQVSLDVDRTRAAYLGLTQEDVVKNVVTSLNSSINFNPSFWIDEKNGNHYFIGAQYPESAIESMSTLEHIPVGGTGGGAGDAAVLLKNVASFSRETAPAEIGHRNISRVTDVYVAVQDRDIGSVAGEIETQLEALRSSLAQEDTDARAAGRAPRWEGYRIHMRGEVASMKESFASLGFGMALATVLVYLILVAQFRSFLDPFIIMLAVPLGAIGVAVTLWATSTPLSIQAFMGVVFMVGISVSNSVLLVEFANRAMAERGLSAADAAVESVRVRLRPILMTSLVAVLALLPMAIGYGRGTEANVPLARTVVGGLTSSTLFVLVLVPVLFALVKGNRRGASEELVHG